jgi:hypothetical protein
VAGAQWRYGLAANDGQPIEGYAETSQRVKLHYHRSGFVSVNLNSSPQQPETRHAQFPQLPDLSRNQVLGISATRPWKLPWIEGEQMRRGDIATRDERWPTHVGFSIAILERPAVADTRVNLHMGNRGHIAGDKQRVVLDLSELGRDAYVVARVHLDYEPRPDFPVGVTVAAYPQPVGADRPDRAMVLWSSSARNPMLAYEDPHELVSEQFLTDLGLRGPIIEHSVQDRPGR